MDFFFELEMAWPFNAVLIVVDSDFFLFLGGNFFECSLYFEAECEFDMILYFLVSSRSRMVLVVLNKRSQSWMISS